MHSWGPPTPAPESAQGVPCWTYSFARASTKASSFIPVVGAFAGGINAQSQSLMLTFGADGILKDFVNSVSGMDVGTGLNAAPKAELEDVKAGKRAR